jgi:multidrug efflux pump subunit AcrA (membrane-fusion protein)
MSDTASELSKLRAALAAAEARADVAESELAHTRAVVSCSEAMIQELKLEIAKLRRDKYGISSERRARLIDQLELQLEELEAGATEDALAAEQAAAKASTVRAFTRRHPVRKPFPDHLPRERVVVEAPDTCSCCGSDRIVKMGEDVTETLERDPAAVEGNPDRAREVQLPSLREDQPATSPVPCDPAWMGRAQLDRHARL